MLKFCNFASADVQNSSKCQLGSLEDYKIQGSLRQRQRQSLQRCIYLVMWPHVWPQDFFLSCRNIQIRVFRANIFKSECFVQKYWSGTVTRYSVMRGCLFGSDQTKYYVHGCNFHSFSGPFIHKKWGKIYVLYDRRQVSLSTK